MAAPVLARNPEAKDLAGARNPGFDLGEHLANRRVSWVLALALLCATAAALVAGTSAVVIAWRTRYVTIPYDVASNRPLVTDGVTVIQDSVAYQPPRLIERAKDYLDYRFAYDYRAGPGKLIAAGQMVKHGFGLTAAPLPPVDLLDRLDSAQTRIDLAYDKTEVHYVGRGAFEVVVFGHKRLRNVQYNDVTGGPRITPFQETVFLRAVRGPDFPDGIAVTGQKGDLEP